MTSAELRRQMAIQYADLIAAEVDRAPLLEEGSDAALALRALVGSDLIDITRARHARERATEAEAA